MVVREDESGGVVLQRLAHDFSRMDEVVFLMGEVHLKLEKTEKAVDYYNKLLKDYPSSEFAKKTRLRLDELKVNR